MSEESKNKKTKPMNYIDAEKLIAEIERRIESWTIRGEHSPAGQGRDTCVSRVTELSDLLSFVTSLQQEQPGVDVEREIDEYYHENLGFIISPIDTRIIVENIARHFYSLGLNARKV